MNELVKYRGPGGTPSPARRAMDKALEKLRGRGQVEQRQAETGHIMPARPVRVSIGEVIDLPRICAVHDRPYVARYIAGKDGRFHYAQTIRVTEALYQGQYAEGVHQTLTSGAVDSTDETCPWCGGHGFASILCKKCGEEICYGRTVGRYFRCRSSCGSEGKMIYENRAHGGITPSLGQRGPQSSR